MRLALVFLATMLLTRSVYCAESATSIESGDLGPVPQEVAAKVTANKSFGAFKSLTCKIKGKAVSLSTDQSTTTWFVTTADACGWGAALGPIWLVEDRIGLGATVILSTGGYALSPSAKSHNGLADVIILAGTASGNASKRYTFDGKSYGTHGSEK